MKDDRSTLQTLTLVFGVGFLAVGILGFVPGITTHYGDLGFAGSDSGSKLLGLFQVSILHNIVHLLFGVAGLLAARSFDSSRIYMLGGGVIFLALFVLGLFGGADWIPANDADDWLHLGLGVVMVSIGYLFGREGLTVDHAAPA
jgi:Domain of unknown function (DUF4383)